MRKGFVVTALVAAGLAMGAPAASASSQVFAGVYPNGDAAAAACEAGKEQGRWWACSFEQKSGQSQVLLWVVVD